MLNAHKILSDFGGFSEAEYLRMLAHTVTDEDILACHLNAWDHGHHR